MIGQKVYGSGPVPAKILLCGEGPGRNEAIQGVPFVGASGADLDYVFLRRAAGLDRKDIYVTNVVKWRTDDEDSDPTPADIARDEPELYTELLYCRPEIIVAVGKIAASWFLNEPVDMERESGVPQKIYVCHECTHRGRTDCLDHHATQYTLLVTYHPAAGLHQTERYYHLIFWCFEQLGRLVRGEIACHAHQGEVHYSEGRGPDDLPDGPMLAVDTEGSVAEPWGLSAAGEPGRAVVLRGGAAAGAALDRPVVGHNMLHDIGVLEALGSPVNMDKIEDTMLAAYLLPYYPRKLKALSYKLLGVVQDEYEDIIAPAEEEVCRRYFQKVLDNKCPECAGAGEVLVPYKRNANKFKRAKCPICAGDCTAWPLPEPRQVFNADSSVRLYHPRSIGRAVRAIRERGTRLREGWENIDETVRAAAVSQLGDIREATLDDVELSRAVHYSAADADCTLQIWNRLKPELEQKGLWNVYQIDKSIIPIIDRMHKNGILINRKHFSALHTEFEREKEKVRGSIVGVATIYRWAAGEGVLNINPASPLQIANLLYDTLKLKPIRGERGTDEKTLEMLKLRYPDYEAAIAVIDSINEYRELDKMDGTYIVPLPLKADQNDRVHTRFLLHVTASGRIASRDPNLQNVPTRSERGRRIRQGFIAKPGCKLVSIDLDQIELRVAAHLSMDPNLIDVFVGAETCSVYLAAGKCHCHDIHTRTAALIYGKPTQDVTTQERVLAKTMNFLILYGGGAGRLHSELTLLGIKVTKDQCMQYINDWFDAFPGIRDYISACHSQAKSMGYVTDLFGRRRYLQGVWSCVDRVREESLKWAVNTPDQGTAAALLKIWMRRIWDNVLPHYWAQGIYCEPLLTIHDEVILEAEEGVCDELIERCVKEALLTTNLAVPIKAKGAAAYNWSELK